LEEVRKDGWMNDYTIVDEIYPLIEYANTCLHEVSETYGSVRLAFNDKMELGRGIVQVMPRIET
jgi:hypothetical protein